jgi:hypothetical protein
MNTDLSGFCMVSVHGFRARRFAAPRNDDRSVGENQKVNGGLFRPRAAAATVVTPTEGRNFPS